MKKRILSIFSLLLLVPLLLANVNAKSVIELDNNIRATGVSESSRFVLGNNVNSDEEVDGLSFILGNDLDIKGSAPYGFYFGNMIYINSNIEKDLFIAGNSVNIGSEAKIGRDVYVASNDLKVNVDIERNLRFVGTTLDIRGITINGNLYTAASEIIMDKDTVINGKFTYESDTKITALQSAKIGSKKAYKNDNSISVWDTLYGVLERIVSALVVLLILFHFFPSFKEKLDKEKLEFNTVIKTMLKGSIVLVIVPIVTFMGLLTGTLTPLALIVLAAYLIGLYLASLISGYLICKSLLKNHLKSQNDIVLIIISVTAIRVLSLIPYVGPIISIITLLYGIGTLYKYTRNKK